MKKSKLILATGAAVAATAALSPAMAADNPFGMQQLSGGYQLAAADDKKKDASCGGDKKKDASCGGDKKMGDKMMDDKKMDDKKKEGSCGGDKKKDASCGAKK